MTGLAVANVACSEAGCAWRYSSETAGDAAEMLAAHGETHAQAGRQAGRQAGDGASHVTAVAESGGKTVGQLAAEERAADLARVITVRCADCPWETTGAQESARRSWAGHRERVHDDGEAVAMVERSLAGAGVRRPGAPMPAGDLEAKLAATRAQGGGHGAAPHEHEPKEEPMPPECKVDGCANRPLDTRGRYAGLCAGHKQERRLAAAAKGQTPVRPEPPKSPEPAPAQAPRASVDAPANESLASLAQAVEEASGRLKTLEADVETARDDLRDRLQALGKRLEELDPFEAATK